MFISKAEKDEIWNALVNLSISVSSLQDRLECIKEDITTIIKKQQEQER